MKSAPASILVLRLSYPSRNRVPPDAFQDSPKCHSKIRKVFANQGNEIGSITKATLGHPEFVFALQGLKAMTETGFCKPSRISISS